MPMIQEILGYFLIGLIGIAGLSVFYLPVFLLLGKKVPVLRQFACLLLAGSILIVLFATVFDFAFLNLADGRGIFVKEHSLNLMPFRFMVEEWLMDEGKKITQEIANIVMFIPLGFLLPVVFKKMRILWRTAVCMAVLSFSIEFVQYFIGRTSDIDDLMLNTIGGVAGYGVFYGFSRLFYHRRFWQKFIGLTAQDARASVKEN